MITTLVATLKRYWTPNVLSGAMLILVLSAVSFTRFYNIDHTARFTQDESTDLVRMKQYWDQKKITLVGPISTDNTKVFSSLTYYMIMPFAAAEGFNPIGPVLGTAFWGVATAVLLLLAVRKKYRAMLLPASLLILVWYPLVEMSRWAWNPHFVVFWFALALLIQVYTEKGSKQLRQLGLFFMALCLGMLFHHHYIAVLATAPFIAVQLYQFLRKKDVKSAVIVIAGYCLPVVPFLLFDLRHPPGLFITKYLFGGQTPHVETSPSVTLALQHFTRNYQVFIASITVQLPFQVFVGLLVPLLIFFDVRSKKSSILQWIIPSIAAVVGGIILNDFQPRYIYPALGFFFIWLLVPRTEKRASLVARVMLFTLIASSLLSIWPQLTVTKVPPDIYSFTKVTQLIAQEIKDNKVNNANVAALAGGDPAPLAEKYRDMIRRYGADVREGSEYTLSENLFVASTNTETAVKNDESFAIQVFKDATLKESFSIPNSEWKVYWYAYQE